MRALLINPRLQTITEIDYDGTPEAMCKLVGCDIFKVASTLKGWLQEGFDTVWVSDDELDEDRYPNRWFQIGIGTDKATNPIAGNGLVVGTGTAGENCPAILSRDELARRVTFKRRKLGFKSSLVPDGLEIRIKALRFTAALGNEGVAEFRDRFSAPVVRKSGRRP